MKEGSSNRRVLRNVRNQKCKGRKDYKEKKLQKLSHLTWSILPFLCNVTSECFTFRFVKKTKLLNKINEIHIYGLYLFLTKEPIVYSHIICD